MARPKTCTPAREVGSPNGIATEADLTLHLRWAQADIDVTLDEVAQRAQEGRKPLASHYSDLGLDDVVMALAKARGS